VLTKEAHHGRRCTQDSLRRRLNDALPSSAHPIPSDRDVFDGFVKCGNKKNRTEKNFPPGRSLMAIYGYEKNSEGLLFTLSGILGLFESAIILLHGILTRRIAAYDETCHHHNGQCKKKQSFHDILLLSVH